MSQAEYYQFIFIETGNTVVVLTENICYPLDNIQRLPPVTAKKLYLFMIKESSILF